jgi:hypothetical protein
MRGMLVSSDPRAIFCISSQQRSGIAVGHPIVHRLFFPARSGGRDERPAGPVHVPHSLNRSVLRLSSIHRTHVILGWILLAAAPVAYIAAVAIAASRNIVFWDEFDTALDLILRIDAGAGWSELLDRFFAVNNEHRTVTSRLLFAASYWLTGTVNFHVIGAIGNLFHVGTCAILVLAVSGWARRLRMGVVLAFLMFQLEHFESLLWSGASIDHFQVVTLAVGVMAALTRGSRRGVVLAVLLGLLATFTLAHGCLVWPIGAWLLWQQGRRQQLAGWIGSGAAVMAVFLYGFEFNPNHNITGVDARHVADVAVYWLALLGGPLTLGDAGFGPIAGAVLLVGLGLAAARGAFAREPLAMFSALFAVGALAMVAVGRAELAGDAINSRYLVLGALAWAMLIFVLVEFATPPERPFRVLPWLAPALVAFNVSANLAFAPLAEGYIEIRERAATAFMLHGRDGRGMARLHPREGHADVLLQRAAERGVYHLPPVSHEVNLPQAIESDRVRVHFDQLVVSEHAFLAGGWAMIPGVESRRGEIYVVLQSATTTRKFSTVTLQRPDVAKAYGEPRWRLAGFRAVIERSRLPAEDYTLGVVIARGGRAEQRMTRGRLELSPGKEPAAVAGGDQE